MAKSLKHMAIRALQTPLILIDCVLFVIFVVFIIVTELLEDFDD